MSTNEKKNWGPIISTIAAIVVFLILYFMPLPEGLTPEAQKNGAFCLCTDHVDCQTDPDLPDIPNFDTPSSYARRCGKAENRFRCPGL